MNILVSFEVIQISSFEKASLFQENVQFSLHKDSAESHGSLTMCPEFILR